MAQKKMGRPAFVLTDDQFKTIEGMARIQCTQDEICDIYGVTDKTLNLALKKHSGCSFSDLIKKNASHGKASLRRNQWKAAEKGNPTMLVWLGKQHLGQKDQVETKATHEIMPFTGFEVDRAVKPDTPDAD